MNVVLAILFLAGLFFWLQFRAKRRAIGREAELKGISSLERTLFNLQVGDVVQYLQRDWILETVYSYQQDDFEWFEYLLRDGTDVAWLVVVEDDWLEVSWLIPVDEHELQIRIPPPTVIRHRDVIYQLKESGKANYSTVGRVNNQAGSCQFFDYRSPDGQVLSLELYGASAEEMGDLDVCIGAAIDPRLLSLLPGDGRSVYAGAPC